MEISLEDVQAYEKGVASYYVESFLKLISYLEEITKGLPQNYISELENDEYFFKDVRYTIFDHLLQNVEVSYVFFKYIYSNSDFLKKPSSIKNRIILKIIYYSLPGFYHTIENSFFTLVYALTGEERQGYNNLVEGVFEELGLSKETDEFKAYTVLAWLRNSMHNNWVHVKDITMKYENIAIIEEDENKTPFNITFNIKGHDFTFTKNRYIELKSNDAFFALLKTIIDSLKNVMIHTKIQILEKQKCYERFANSLSQVPTTDSA